jgi:hypothetical protein
MPTDNPRIVTWNRVLAATAERSGAALVTATAAGPIDPPAGVQVYGLGEPSNRGASGAEIGLPAIAGRVWNAGSTLTLLVADGSDRYEGVCRVIKRSTVGLARGGDVKTLILRGPSLVESAQRRHAFRLNTVRIVERPVWLTPLPRGEEDARFGRELLEGELIDASEGGVRVRVRTTPELRQKIERCQRYAVRLELPDDAAPAVAQAEVAHLHKPRDGWSDLGMRFLDDDASDAKAGRRVADFVAWAQRCQILEQRERSWQSTQRAKAG